MYGSTKQAKHAERTGKSKGKQSTKESSATATTDKRNKLQKEYNEYLNADPEKPRKKVSANCKRDLNKSTKQSVQVSVSNQFEKMEMRDMQAQSVIHNRSPKLNIATQLRPNNQLRRTQDLG